MKAFILFISFTLSVIASPAQTATERDSSICVTSSRLCRMGKQLLVSIQVNITRSIASNQSVILVPQLNDSVGNFMQLPSIHINGRKQHIVFQREAMRQEPECEGVRRQNDRTQTIHYLRSVPFSDWMELATLSLIERNCGCGVPYNTDSTYLTRLNLLSSIHPRLAFMTPDVEEIKLREESGQAFLDFPLNEITIHPEYRNNPAELSKIKHSIDLIKNDSNVIISNINIHGYASPEGPYTNNEQLASKRTLTLQEYVRNQYAFSDTIYTTQYTPEDWEGLIRMLKDTPIAHADELLHIAESNDAPDRKEEKMRKRYPQQFNFMLENWFPALRHSDYTIRYVVRPFTIEQAKNVFDSNPKNLSIEEMFRIAHTYEAGSAEYNKIFMTAVLLNPDHPIANLNAACILLDKGDTAGAEIYLEKASDSPQKTLAKGVLKLLKGQYEEAETLLKEAKDNGMEEAAYNLNLLHELYY